MLTVEATAQPWNCNIAKKTNFFLGKKFFTDKTNTLARAVMIIKSQIPDVLLSTNHSQNISGSILLYS